MTARLFNPLAEAATPPMNPQLVACLRTVAPFFTHKLSQPVGAARFAGRGGSGKPWGRPNLSLAPKKPLAPARPPALPARMTRPCTKGTRDSIFPGSLGGGCSWSWGHGPQSWGHRRSPRPHAHPPTGTEPKQTCLVRASGAKSSPELSCLVDFCLKTLLG